MHRNTFLLIGVLSVIASLIIGVNIGRQLSAPSQTKSPQENSAEKLPTPSPQASATVPYTSSQCGIAIRYPASLTKFDNASNSAIFTNANNPSESVAITCQENIPRPPLPPEKIESITVWNEDRTSSIAARLYHDASPKDGTPMDAIIFRHPKSGLDVFLAGYGEIFNQILQTLRLLP